jgi:hypothetical protein
MCPNEPSGVPWQHYVDIQIDNLEKTLNARLEAMQRAVDIAEHRMDGKLVGMNEWRQTLQDRDKEYARQEQVNRIQKWIDISGGRWQALTVGGVLLSIITMILTLFRILAGEAK